MNVTTHHNDNARTGTNLSETVLTVDSVRKNFGRLFERKVNGAVYAQPLFVAGVNLPNVGVRNVLYVASMRNMVYAFDADDPSASAPLWGPVSLGPHIHLPDAEVGGPNYQDIVWEVGIVGTPVIDLMRNALYVVAATKEANVYRHELHKLDLATGALTSSQPIVANVGSAIFRSGGQNQRPGLVLANDRVYAGFASYFDKRPYQGWIMAFNPDTLVPLEVFCTTPATGEAGGIWMAGEAPAVDNAGNLYFTTGNGAFNGDRTNPATEFGDCFVKLTPDLQVASWFSPFDNAALTQADADLGSAGVLIIPNTNRLVGGGKEGKFYLLDESALGGYHSGSDSQIPQSFYVTVPAARTLGETHHIHGCPTVWAGPMGMFVYVWPEWEFLKAFAFVGNHFPPDASGSVNPAAQGTTGATPGMPGGFLSISANGAAARSGILWANHPWYADANQSVVEGVLRAYDASNLREIWNSRTNRTRDDFGNFAKFCPPTVANGKVYLPTMGGLHRKVTIWNDYAREGGAVANLNDNLLVMGWTGIDSPGHLNVRWSNDGINWPGKSTNWNETSWHGPALTNGLSQLFMAWTGTDGHLNVHASTNCVSWINKVTLWNETSDSGPALTFGNGRLYLAWTGTDGHLNVMSSVDGLQWVNKVTLWNETSPSAPALAFLSGNVFLLWCGTGNLNLNFIQSSDGIAWGNKATFWSETSDSAPALAADANTPFLSWRGRGNQQINQMTPQDGDPHHVADKRTFSDTAVTSPTLAGFQNRMYVGWTGTDGHLNAAVLSLGGVSAYTVLGTGCSPVQWRQPIWALLKRSGQLLALRARQLVGTSRHSSPNARADVS